MIFDVAVIGVGAMGGSATYHLAKAGNAVIAFDQFSVPHDRGSSHAETRLIRQAYFENPNYVPLLRRAYELWDQLEESPGRLFIKNGLFIAGRPERTVMQGVRLSATTHGIKTETFEAKEARERFPGFHFADGEHCIFEPGAGYLKVDEVLKTQIAAALRHGALIHQNTEVRSIRKEHGGFLVETSKGDYKTKKVVVAGGAWNGQLLSEILGKRLTPYRVPLFWFAQNGGTSPGGVCFAYDLPQGFFYGFPPLNDGLIKAGLHKAAVKIEHPSQFDRSLADNERDPVRSFVRERLQWVQPVIEREATCIYTMTSDEDFIIDEIDGIVVLAGFSGHGFKFASVIGEIAKDLVTTGKSSLPYYFLKLR